ncbi:MAG: glucosaminidase domain-containing protein [Hyphomicrobium sp.]|nr:glucosaminidase domain-containing protein [Hyphomicrobium sp.]
MMCRVRAQSAFVLATAVSVVALTAPAFAADLPPIKQTAKNSVPACVTPGRLMSFLEARNKNLDNKFATIAADYARVGGELQIRWDTAFFQMLLETGNLTFTGDVSPDQNNFAGLGATGKKEPGETFPDVATGVKAHLQHLLMYSGEKLDNPVAERTRKVQEWGVLTAWQKTIDGPMTYVHLAKKWAPGSKSYARDIENVAEAFMDGPCKSADPKPEMMALVKPDAALAKPAAEAKIASAEKPAAFDTAYTPPKVSGAELAKKAADEARANGSYVRSSLGAGMLAAMSPPEATAPAAPAAQPSVKILNAPKVEPLAEAPAASEPQAKVQTAALGAGTKSVTIEAPSATAAANTSKCKVWTASYGGNRAVIIKASADAQDNYTVLDVNEGTEQREADAYISAYAKGGLKVGEFNTPTQALDKAFELCPEG